MAEATAAIVGEQLKAKFPRTEGLQLVHDDTVELVLNRTWRPTLCVTGAGGLPALRVRVEAEFARAWPLDPELLEAVGPDGRVLGIDRDSQALELARQRLAHFGDRFVAVRGNHTDLHCRKSWAGRR